MRKFQRSLAVVWGAGLVCFAVGCGVSGPGAKQENAEADAASAEELAKEAKEAKAEKEAAEEESLQAQVEKTWAWQAREMGKVVKEEITRCQDYGISKISPTSASKMMPSVSLKELRGHCEVLTTHYGKNKVKYWGTHYSVDSLIGNLARFTDAYEHLVPVWKEGKPSTELQDGLQALVNATRTLSRSASMVAGMDLSAKPVTEVSAEPLSKGQMRASVTRVARDADGPDLEKLGDKLDAYGIAPSKEGTPVYRHALEHFGNMFAQRLKNRRTIWLAMRTDDPKYDQAFKKVAFAYLDECEALLAEYQKGADLYTGDSLPSTKEAKAAGKALGKAMAVWKKSLQMLPDALGDVKG